MIPWCKDLIPTWGGGGTKRVGFLKESRRHILHRAGDKALVETPLSPLSFYSFSPGLPLSLNMKTIGGKGPFVKRP